MTAYISLLTEASKREAAEHASREKGLADDTCERLTPLKDRLARLLATIPAEVLQEGISLAALQSGLKGRWRGACHPGELGTALRKAGFVRRRKWADDDGFPSLWFPPSSPGGFASRPNSSGLPIASAASGICAIVSQPVV